ncbi:MAG: Cfr10I/Bse634I family restriction endonuclease [Bacteroidota bacterium]
MDYITQLPSGQKQINKSVAFCNILNKQLPHGDSIITDILTNFDKTIKAQNPKITTGALSNSHGDWYEWLLAITAWNYFIESKNSYLALLLPNVSTFNVAELYKKDLSDLIVDLRKKVSDNTSVQLISSNPDFLLLDTKNIELSENDFKPIKVLTIENIQIIEKAYTKFIAKCDFNDIIGYLSVKTSLRPDRRLQIPHEGSLMKAIYIHLQTRKWIINPKGLKYYAFATRVSKSDRKALKTVATHSITTVFNLPQAAVDEVFEVNSINQALLAFNEILH